MTDLKIELFDEPGSKTDAFKHSTKNSLCLYIFGGYEIVILVTKTVLLGLFLGIGDNPIAKCKSWLETAEKDEKSEYSAFIAAGVIGLCIYAMNVVMTTAFGSAMIIAKRLKAKYNCLQYWMFGFSARVTFDGVAMLAFLSATEDGQMPNCISASSVSALNFQFMLQLADLIACVLAIKPMYDYTAKLNKIMKYQSNIRISGSIEIVSGQRY